MNDIETIKGKLQLLVTETYLENTCKEICQRKGKLELDSFCNNWIDQIQEDFHENYIILNKNLYSFIEKTEMNSEGFEEAHKNPDGTIDFFVQWYNGGASLNEVLEDAIKKIGK